MNFDNQSFIKEFKILIEKEKESNKSIKGEVIRSDNNVLDISTRYTTGLTKNMPVEVNRVKAKIIDVKNRNITLTVEDESVFKINQRVSIQNVQKDIIIHKLQETFDDITSNNLNKENIETLNIIFSNEKATFKNLRLSIKNLNRNQKRAVEKSLQSNKFHLIQGPPGTGKTHTIIEIIKQLYNEDKRILITTHTHIALDNILERLDLDERKVLRIGSDDKISSKVLRFTMNNHIRNHEFYDVITEKEDLIEKLSRDDKIDYGSLIPKRTNENFISRVFRSLLNIKDDNMGNGDYRRSNPGENKDLIHELNEEIESILENIQSDVLGNIRIFATTVLSSSGFLTKDLDFDYVIMDEASQVPVYLALIPLLKTDKFILIGDNMQLQPIRNVNSSYTLNKSIFNLLIDKYPDNYTFLNIQYRMNEQISNMASKLYYGGKLLTGDSVKNQRIVLKDSKCFLLDDGPVTLLDTSGVNFDESNVSGGCCNKYESSLIVSIVEALKSNDVSLDEIGVITPYRKQKLFIRNLLVEKCLDVECDTIYRFQGREKDVIIVSFCKSSNKSLTKFQESFLADENQLNVSITRSRKKLILIGNFAMLKSAVNIKNLLDEISLEDVLYLSDFL
ncbi:MAG: hypothetical protein BZ138_01265 [Methanosphaera sp. rholeuAM270]|nr:MAG: hypothetical protein BZ138_01265 [Methanosphaera sp. rholeuAM270]